MPPIINAQGLAKAFGATPLFDNISFTVSEGDRIGLIGPNGSGKSTLLGILSGAIDPDSGEVAVRKRTRHELRAAGIAVRARRYRAGGDWRALWNAAILPTPTAPGDCLRRWAAPDSLISMPPRIRSPAAGASAWRLPKRWCSSPMSCCWTNPPTILTLKALSGWKSCCKAHRLPAWW